MQQRPNNPTAPTERRRQLRADLSAIRDALLIIAGNALLTPESVVRIEQLAGRVLIELDAFGGEEETPTPSPSPTSAHPPCPACGTAAHLTGSRAVNGQRVRFYNCPRCRQSFKQKFEIDRADGADDPILG